MPDGRRLAVANGGIETDPTSGRAELNIATMVSSLAYVDAGTGHLLDVLGLAPNTALLSIRHLAAGRDGTLAAALQWQGLIDAPPLLAVHRAGTDALELLAADAAVPAPHPQLRRLRCRHRRRPPRRLLGAPRQHDADLRPRRRQPRPRLSRPPTSAASPPPAPASPARPATGLFLKRGAAARRPATSASTVSPSTTTSSASPRSPAA